MPVKPIPEGYHAITPYLAVHGAEKLIDFLKKAFDAKLEKCHKTPDGKIMNAEIRIGDSMLMAADAPPHFPPKPCRIYLYVKDTDASYKRALAAGGTSIMEPADMFYGDRNAGVLDPAGNEWWIATHFKDVTPEDMKRGAEERAKKSA